MIIAPILAPSLSGLAATAALRGNLLTWTASSDAILFGAEVWASQTNDRTTASKVATVFDNTFMHLTAAGALWYYWIRGVSIYGRSDGAWFPVSSTAGISSTSLLAQTADIAAYAVTSVSLSQAITAQSQTAYGTWEMVNMFPLAFYGTGNIFIIDCRHFGNLTLSTAGTSQSASAQQRMTVNEYTYYSAGTLSLTNGSAVVTGTGTLWSANLSAGQTMIIAGARISILSVDSNTQVTLTGIFGGATISGVAYLALTSTTVMMTLTQTVNKFEIIGTYCITGGTAFSHRVPLVTSATKMYDIILEWSLLRDNATWSISNASVVRTVIMEEIKR